VLEVLDMSHDQLAKYIAGTSRPTFEAMVRLTRDRGVSLDWLATGEGPFHTLKRLAMFHEQTASLQPTGLAENQPAQELERFDAGKAALDRAAELVGWEPPPNLRHALLTVALAYDLSLGHLTLLLDAAKRDLGGAK
jgi:hypothetical protein